MPFGLIGSLFALLVRVAVSVPLMLWRVWMQVQAWVWV
jgi:hypothetical protein